MTYHQISYVADLTGLSSDVVVNILRITNSCGVHGLARSYVSSNKPDMLKELDDVGGLSCFNAQWWLFGPKGIWKIRVVQ